MTETNTQVMVNNEFVTALTEIEDHQLAKCEQIIKGGLGTFLNVGQALATIRDNRLYRMTHLTFESYCKEIWDLSKSKAYYDIAAYETVNLLKNKTSTIVDISNTPKQLPTNEAQTRPLTKLKDPEDQIKAWQLVLDQLNDGEKLTAALIAKAVKEVRGEVVTRTFKETREAVGKTTLVSNLFAKQAQVMLDIIRDERNSGWKTTSMKEAVNIFTGIIKFIKEEY